MTSQLRVLGMTLPEPPRPVGAYVAAIRVGDVVMTSGQLPMVQGRLIAAGKVPEDVPLEEAREAAKVAALNALAAAAAVVGDVDKLARVVRLGVFVNSSPGFAEQAIVANGASELLVSLFGDEGRHVRAAIGASELPLGAALELELTVAVRD